VDCHLFYMLKYNNIYHYLELWKWVKKNTSNTSKFLIIFYRQLLIERRNSFDCTDELEYNQQIVMYKFQFPSSTRVSWRIIALCLCRDRSVFAWTEDSRQKYNIIHHSLELWKWVKNRTSNTSKW
jgi:hypothetical protein